MGLFEFLLLVLIAGVCGSIGQAIAGNKKGGFIVSIVVGFIGALLGSWLSAQLGLPEILSIDISGRAFPVIWSIIGSIVFVVVLGFFTGRK